VRRADRTAIVERSQGLKELYDIVLLAGTPRRMTLPLAREVATEDVIEVAGELWTVADVRPADSGPSQLICIHAE
jgi:hypothetical protein